MGTTNASVTLQSFSRNGKIYFSVETFNCQDSAGRFEYEYEFNDTMGNHVSKDRRQTWSRTHNSGSFVVSDDAPIADGELISVRVISGSVEADCFD